MGRLCFSKSAVVVVVLILAAQLADSTSSYAEPVIFDATTGAGNDTLFVGAQGTIIFTVDSDGHELDAVTWPVIWRFTNGNIMGPFSSVTGEVVPSADAVAAFETIGWNPFYAQGLDPDTSLYGFLDFDGQGYTGSGPLWSVTFTPLDIGAIIIDSTVWRVGPSVGWPHTSEVGGGQLTSTFAPVTIHVVECPVELTGDVNETRSITSADIISLLGYVFRGKATPMPCAAAGDVNCDGRVNSADVIYMVNHVFKGLEPPCNVCVLIADGTWECD